MGKGIKSKDLQTALATFEPDDTPVSGGVKEALATFEPDEETTPQKKSPAASEPTSAAPSQPPQGGVSATSSFRDNISKAQSILAGQDQIGGNPVAVKDIPQMPGTQPIGYTDIGKDRIPVATNETKGFNEGNYTPVPADNIKNATTVIANDYTNSGGADINHLSAITDPHGDPAVIGSYIKGRLAQMNAVDPSHATAHAKESDELMNNLDYIQKLQLANREIQLTRPEENQSPHAIAYTDMKKNLGQAHTAFDPVELGIELAAYKGDDVARRDLLNYRRGHPISDDRKVQYEASGYDVMQTGAKAAKVGGSEDAAKELEDHSDNPYKRLEKNNPKYFRKIWGNQLGDYVYDKEENPLYGTLYAKDKLTPAEIQEYGKKAGLKQYQIDQLTPDDVPTAASWPGQAAQSAFNTILLKDEKSPGGKFFTGDMPQSQKRAHEWKGILGEVASGAGTVAGFMAQGGLTGAALKTTGALGDVAINASRYEKSANLIPIAAANYNDAYKKSEEVIGDDPEDGIKRGIYTIALGTISTAIMSIDPVTKLGKDAIGTTVSKDLVNMLKKTPAEDITKEAVQSTIVKGLKKYAEVAGVTGQHIASQAFIMSSNKVAENVTDMIFDPKHRHDVMDGVGDAAIHASISMFLPSLMAGFSARKSNTPLNRDIAFNIGSDPGKFINQINRDVADRKTTPEDAQIAHEGILNMKNAVSRTPIENVDKDPLTDQQRKDYAFNLFQQQQLQGKLDATKADTKIGNLEEDKSQTAPIDARIKELIKANDDILANAGKEIPKPEAPKAKKPAEKTKDVVQSMIDDYSMGEDVTSEYDKQQIQDYKDYPEYHIDERIKYYTDLSEQEGYKAYEKKRLKVWQDIEKRFKAAQEQEKPDRGAEPSTERRNEAPSESEPLSQKEKTKEKIVNTEKENIPLTPQENNKQKANEDEKIRNEDQGQNGTESRRNGQKSPDAEEAANSEKRGQQQENRELGQEPEVTPKGEQQRPDVNQPEPTLQRKKRKALKPDKPASESPEAKSGEIPIVKKEEEEKPNQGTEPSTERRNEVPSEPIASAIKDFTPPQPEKPLHEMTGQELSDYHDKLKKHNKELDKNILGEKYEEYQKAQRTSETPTASKEAREAAHKTIKEIEEALTPEQRKALFSEGLPEGAIINESEVKEYQNKVEHVEASANESELAKAISNSLIDLNSAPPDAGKMTAKQKQALAAMIAAKRVIEERGYDGKKVTQEALKNAADKFSDKNDAEFMLSKYLDFKQEKTQQNASTQSKKQLKEGGPKSSQPEHARVEQSGSKAKAAEAKNSNIIQRSQAETPVKAETIIRNIGEYKIADAFGNIPKAKPSLFVQKGDWHYPLKKSMDAEKVIKKHESGNLEILRIGEIRNVIKEAFPDADEKNAMSGTIYMTANGKTIRISDHNENSNASRGESDLYFYAGQTTKNKIISELKDKVPVELKGEKSNQAPADERSVTTNPSSEPPAPAPKELTLVEKKTLALNNLKEQHDDLNFQKEELETKLDNAYAKSKVDPAEVDDLEKQISEKRQEIAAKKKALDLKQRELEIQQSYAKGASKIRKLGGDTKGMIGAFPGLSPKIASAILDRIGDIYEKFGNLHIAALKGLEWAKEQFKDEKGIEAVTENDVRDLIRPHLPVLDQEPIIKDADYLEYAKDALSDIRDGVSTYEEVRQEIVDHDQLQDKTKGHILNYIDYHLESQESTSIRNATTRLKREQFGLNEEIPAGKKEFGETWEEAKDKLENQHYDPRNLVAELSKTPRPLTDVENAILLHHQNEREIRLLDINKSINKAAEEGNQADLIEQKTAKAHVLDELQKIYDVNKAVGTENARGLASRRMMTDRKYSLVNMIAEKRATTNDGQPLSEEQQAHIEALHQKIHETQEAFDNYVKQKQQDILDLQRKVLTAQQEKTQRKSEGATNPNASEVEKKQTASKKVADKLRSWADKIEGSTKNQAYSSPIPVTPKMVADALRFVADGVEKGGEILDFVQKAIVKAKATNPGIDESHLESQVNQALIDAGVAQQSQDANSTIRKIKLMSPFFKDGKLDREAVRLNVAANRAKAEFDHDILRDKEKQLSKTAKAQNAFIKWQRMFKLSNPITLGKLAMAGMTRLATTPLEDVVGGAASKIFPQLAKGAIGEGGGLNVNETAKAYKDGLMLGMKDAGQVIKWGGDGKSDLDVLFGKSGDLPPEAIDFFGQLHSAIKAPFKRVIFERQLAKRLRRNLANGVDISDPMVQTSILTDAYKDANRAIFMQDNKVAEGWQKMVRYFNEVDPRTGEAPYKIIGTSMQWLVPFVKVPTNIVAETSRGIYGLPVAAWQIHKAFKKGVENLTPDQKDIIFRNLKKGSLGAAALLIGYFNPENFGGYYQQKQKRDEEDAEPLGLKLFGHKIAAWFAEFPIFQIMQFGATIRRVQDQYVHGEKNDIGDGAWAAVLGLAEHVPMASQPMQISNLFRSKEDRKYYLGELAKSTVDPALISYLARVTDPADEGSILGKAIMPENKRKSPKTTWEHIKSGLPYFREDLPEK